MGCADVLAEEGAQRMADSTAAPAGAPNGEAEAPASPTPGPRRGLGEARPADELPEISTLEALVALVEWRPGLFVRWSTGPDHDASERSRDHASGLDLPGLAVNPLDPPRWWTLPAEQWVARQIRTYAHLGEESPDHVAWVLAGQVVDRGPDNEPLVVGVEPVGRLATSVLQEAADCAPESPRPEDSGAQWHS